MWDITEDVQHKTLCIYRIAEDIEEEDEETVAEAEAEAEAAVAVRRYEYIYTHIMLKCCFRMTPRPLLI